GLFGRYRVRLAATGGSADRAHRQQARYPRARGTAARPARAPHLMIFQANPTEDKMEVILLERIGKLGQMGEVVRVKDGYARNFLLPKGKALRATPENRTRFETMKVELNARNLQLRSEAEKIAAKLDGSSFIVLRQAGETGHLYGSVSTRDLATILSQSGFVVERSQLALNAPIKTIGLHKIPISL